jgi:hypothetical protein
MRPARGVPCTHFATAAEAQMNWRKIFPWAAVAGAILGVMVGDYLLVFLAVLLFAGAIFWWPEPGDEPDE